MLKSSLTHICQASSWQTAGNSLIAAQVLSPASGTGLADLRENVCDPIQPAELDLGSEFSVFFADVNLAGHHAE